LSKRKRKRHWEDGAIVVIYALIIIAFMSAIFCAWWTVFRTTQFYHTPYPVVEAWDI